MSVAREENDFYRTPPQCVRSLLSVEVFDPLVWECACGDGAISEVLKAAGYDVVSTDLIDRNYGDGQLDFLNTDNLIAPSVVTNPPYKDAEAFVCHALKLGASKVAMLLRLAWLEGEKRYNSLFSVTPPSRVWVLSSRPTLWHGTDPNARNTGGAIAYAWFIWDKSSGPTQLGWLGKETGAHKHETDPR